MNMDKYNIARLMITHKYGKNAYEIANNIIVTIGSRYVLISYNEDLEEATGEFKDYGVRVEYLLEGYINIKGKLVVERIE